MEPPTPPPRLHAHERVRTPRIISVECPVCGGKLRGTRTAGYHCMRCKAYYTARHATHMQKHHLRTLIHERFSPQRAEATQPSEAPVTKFVQEESEAIIIEDKDDTITHAINEARIAVQENTKHLEEMLETQHAYHLLPMKLKNMFASSLKRKTTPVKKK
jgi:hypothetical protein